jgi:hypothetical protein
MSEGRKRLVLIESIQDVVIKKEITREGGLKLNVLFRSVLPGD